MCLARAEPLLEIERQNADRDDPDRQVDPEHEGPVQVLHQDRAQDRSNHRRQSPDAGEPALQAGAVRGRIEVAHDGGRDRLDGASAQALKGTEYDQREHAPGEAAGRRSDQEDAGADEEHPFAAENVGESTVDRRSDRLGEEIGREHPAEQPEAAEIGHDRRHRGGHDGAFHRRHEDRHHAGSRHQASMHATFGGKRRGRGGLFDQGGNFGFSASVASPPGGWARAAAHNGIGRNPSTTLRTEYQLPEPRCRGRRAHCAHVFERNLDAPG